MSYAETRSPGGATDSEVVWASAFRSPQSAVLTSERRLREGEGNDGVPETTVADWGVATAVAPGTCGELVQGHLNGRDFLITCPVNLYSRVTITLCEGQTIAASGDRPLSKTATAVERFLRSRGYVAGATIRVESALAEGKGLASSSADIAAGIHAAAEALGVDVPAHDVGRFAASVEPTDAVFYPGIVIYDQVKGELLEPLGEPPPIQIFIVDGGDTLDTLSFDRQLHRAVARKNQALLERAVNLVRQGLRTKAPELVGLGATLSAQYHQEVRENLLIEPLLDVSARTRGIGVNVAHSGTVAGLMYDRRRCDHAEVAAAIAETVGIDKLLAICTLTGGGSHLQTIVGSGISSTQRSFISLFGPPIQRVPCPGGFALEFQHPTAKGVRYFVYPDGTLLLDGPDPSHCMAPVDAWRRPEPGEVWEMRVVVMGHSERDTRYLPVPTEPVKPGIVRVLPTTIFECAFEAAGEYATRKVQVVSCEQDKVTYRSIVKGRTVSVEVSTLPIPIFLANYRLAQNAPGGWPQ